MVVGCGTGCDHGQMSWWNDAIMQDAECGVMRDISGGAMHVANIWCDLKCGLMCNAM